MAFSSSRSSSTPPNVRMGSEHSNEIRTGQKRLNAEASAKILAFFCQAPFPGEGEQQAQPVDRGQDLRP